MDRLNGQMVIENALEHGRQDSKEKETAIAILEVLSAHKTTVGQAISALDRARQMIIQERINLSKSINRVIKSDENFAQDACDNIRDAFLRFFGPNSLPIDKK